LIAKVTDVVGPYLAPPQNAIVLRVDEKSQIQAFDRTPSLLPMLTGDIERRTHDYKRHGTTTIFAALEIATSQVTGALKPKHRPRSSSRSSASWIGPTPEVRAWLHEHPRFVIHFTPTSASWLNLVAVWFGIIDRQATRRGCSPA
jgi:hypothetical protein